MPGCYLKFFLHAWISYITYILMNQKISHSPSHCIFIECYSAPCHVWVLGINKCNPYSQVISWILISETDSNMEIIWSISWFQVISSTKMSCRGECTIYLGKSREASGRGQHWNRDLNKDKVTILGYGKVLPESRSVAHLQAWRLASWSKQNKWGWERQWVKFRKCAEARLDGLFWVTISNLILIN